MPISAYYNGQYVVSTLMSDKEWNAMVKDMRNKRTKSELKMSWSGYPCKPRTSASGLRHFAHLPGYTMKSVTSPTKDMETLSLYTQILKTAQKIGWSGKVEVPPVVETKDNRVVTKSYRDWVSGVILTRGNQQIAIEVTSGYSPESIKLRNEQYRKDGIRCMWLSVGGTHGIESRDMPILNLQMNLGHNARIHLANGEMQVGRFVRNLLGGNIRYASMLNIWSHHCSCGSDVFLWCKQYSVHPRESPYMEANNPVYSDKTAEMVSAYVYGRGIPVAGVIESDTGVKALVCPNCSNIYTEADMIELKADNMMSMPYSTQHGGRWVALTNEQVDDFKYASENLDPRLIHLYDK